MPIATGTTLKALLELANNPTIYAPCCGRRTSADQVQIVAPEINGSPLACPGCRASAATAEG